jgi:hypothetical protein
MAVSQRSWYVLTESTKPERVVFLMDTSETKEAIRNLFNACDSDKVESLLVQCADWGINIRMFLNGQLLELDLMKNYEGHEVTFVEDRDKGTIQIDELSDLLGVTGMY